ncbi:hypothetical protein KP509_11G069100 [Ceratopteris richardii]|nr:hypothetical protein KP509_11G069100 [Ceratopteris richardii]
MPILRTSFRGEKLGSSSLSGSVFCNGAREAGYPFRVSPQKLQVQAMKRIKGKVVCSSNDKTVSVEVVRLYTHPKYKKRVKSSKKYHAHDEENRCQVGDFVTLVSCAPVSKTKKFMVSEVVPKREAAPEETVDLEIMKPLEIAIAKLRAATKAAKS